MLTPWASSRQPTRPMLIEGVEYRLNWAEFTVGSSFFIPCVDAETAEQALRKKMERLGYAVISKIVIEEGIRGVRIWRTKRQRGATL